MKETARLLNTSFSTADAEEPKFYYDDRVLILEFTDWNERQIKIKFHESVAVKWQETDSPGPQDRNDRTYEILNSNWLNEHLSQRMIEPVECHKHFKLCFNACGVFEVIAIKIEEVLI